MDHDVTCAFCGKTIATVEEAIQAGWEPTFYVPGDAIESGEPICPPCQKEHCEWHGDELTLKPDHPDPTSIKTLLAKYRAIDQAFKLTSPLFILGYITNVDNTDDGYGFEVIMFPPDIASDDQHRFKVIEADGQYTFEPIKAN